MANSYFMPLTMTPIPSHPFPLDSEQSQCLALCTVPPPEASAKGGRITLLPSISLNPPISSVNSTLSKNDTSALLNMGGTLLQCGPERLKLGLMSNDDQKLNFDDHMDHFDIKFDINHCQQPQDYGC